MKKTQHRPKGLRPNSPFNTAPRKGYKLNQMVYRSPQSAKTQEFIDSLIRAIDRSKSK